MSQRAEAVERPLAIAHKWLFYALGNAECISDEKLYERLFSLLQEVTSLQEALLKF